LDLDLGLHDIEHPGIAVCVTVSSIPSEVLKPLSGKALSSPAGRFFMSNQVGIAGSKVLTFSALSGSLN
jgi:hypothetical protein